MPRPNLSAWLYVTPLMLVLVPFFLLPTLVVLMAAIRSFSGDDERHSYGRADRNSATPAL